MTHRLVFEFCVKIQSAVTKRIIAMHLPAEIAIFICGTEKCVAVILQCLSVKELPCIKSG